MYDVTLQYEGHIKIVAVPGESREDALWRAHLAARCKILANPTDFVRSLVVVEDGTTVTPVKGD